MKGLLLTGAIHLGRSLTTERSRVPSPPASMMAVEINDDLFSGGVEIFFFNELTNDMPD